MLEIGKAGSYQITTQQLRVRAEGETVLFIHSDCDIAIVAQTKTKIHLVNESAERISVQVEVGGNFLLTLASLNAASLTFELSANLSKKEASLKVVTASISSYSSDFKYDIEHQDSSTFSEIDSYGICLSDCVYSCQVKGTISPGCKNSEAYQNTRVLTAGAIDKVKVLPILEMSENEIRAKHACSIGRLAQEQQYYLASFGLNELQITQLIARGYLSNILQEIETVDLKQNLQEQIERKVSDLCLM